MERFKKHLKCVGIWLGFTFGAAIGLALLVLYMAFIGLMGDVFDSALGDPWGKLTAFCLLVLGPIMAPFAYLVCEDMEKRRKRGW